MQHKMVKFIKCVQISRQNRNKFKMHK